MTTVEQKLIALIVASIRYGFDRDSIIEYVTHEVEDRATLQRCFLEALEINDDIDAQFGKSEIAVSVVVEHVRKHFANLGLMRQSMAPIISESPLPAVQFQSAVVTRSYLRGSSSELSLSQVGQKVSVIEEAGAWIFVEDPRSGASGWVPRDILSFTSTVEND
jgi:hypothetical protein